jgi:hypothetical protein
MNIKKIKDLTDKNWLELENVFVWIYDKKNQLDHVIYDENTRYICAYHNAGLEEHLLKKISNLPDLKTTPFIEIEEATSFLYQSALPAAHNYMPFAASYENLQNKKLGTILTYETDYGFYNSFIDFVVEHMIDVDHVYKCKTGGLYKVKKLKLSVNREDVYKKFHLYSKKLDEIIPNTGTNHKSYNLKLSSNSKLNVTGGKRSFTNEQYILNVMKKYNYLPLDFTSEYNKQISLRNSSTIILNWGGNHYINCSSLFDKKKNILVLCHKGYAHEYNETFQYLNRTQNYADSKVYGNNIRFVYDLDDEIPNLDEIVNDFEEKYLNQN